MRARETTRRLRALRAAVDRARSAPGTPRSCGRRSPRGVASVLSWPRLAFGLSVGLASVLGLWSSARALRCFAGLVGLSWSVPSVGCGFRCSRPCRRRLGLWLRVLAVCGFALLLSGCRSFAPSVAVSSSGLPPSSSRSLVPRALGSLRFRLPAVVAARCLARRRRRRSRRRRCCLPLRLAVCRLGRRCRRRPGRGRRRPFAAVPLAVSLGVAAVLLAPALGRVELARRADGGPEGDSRRSPAQHGGASVRKFPFPFSAQRHAQDFGSPNVGARSFSAVLAHVVRRFAKGEDNAQDGIAAFGWRGEEKGRLLNSACIRGGPWIRACLGASIS